MSIVLALLGLAATGLVYWLGYCAGHRNGHYEAGRLFGGEFLTDAPTVARCGGGDDASADNAAPEIVDLLAAAQDLKRPSAAAGGLVRFPNGRREDAAPVDRMDVRRA